MGTRTGRMWFRVRVVRERTVWEAVFEVAVMSLGVMWSWSLGVVQLNRKTPLREVVMNLGVAEEGNVM